MLSTFLSWRDKLHPDFFLLVGANSTPQALGMTVQKKAFSISFFLIFFEVLLAGWFPFSRIPIAASMTFLQAAFVLFLRPAVSFGRSQMS